MLSDLIDVGMSFIGVEKKKRRLSKSLLCDLNQSDKQ